MTQRQELGFWDRLDTPTKVIAAIVVSIGGLIGAVVAGAALFGGNDKTVVVRPAAGAVVVQHCHQIGDAVRDTLRAVAVAPHHPRRYCLIDRQETYKILKTYEKL